ncbi:hypothetical protein BJ165DRAFT_1531007 [Panaeolus papilionaceus]|nr:hypothetical protein BJ165DRAFT_1531007 [Panaeolus papilionaceus]
MPESQEEDASFILVTEFFKTWKDKTEFNLLGIHADTTNNKSKAYNAVDGHVIRLLPTCTIKRGSSGNQTPVWPPAFASACHNGPLPPLSSLVLQGAHPANRAIILDFKNYFLKLNGILEKYGNLQSVRSIRR